MNAVTVYGEDEKGCWACAPRRMKLNEIEVAVAEKNPGDWGIREDLTFSGRRKQGFTCEHDTDYRHWYLEARS